jgi:hypothetical protein
MRPTWSAKVPRWKIRRLYEGEAVGLLDDELVDDVGSSLLERCRDILTATAAHQGLVRCPSCATMIERSAPPKVQRDEIVRCPACPWSLAWRVYHASYRNKGLIGGSAMPGIEGFAASYQSLNTSRERFVAIDRLIHYFHGEAADMPIRPAARNFIGGTPTEILELLDGLAEGPGTSDETRVTRRDYAAKLARRNAVVRDIQARSTKRG